MIDATKQFPKTGFNTYGVNKHLEHVFEAIKKSVRESFQIIKYRGHVPGETGP